VTAIVEEPFVFPVLDPGAGITPAGTTPIPRADQIVQRAQEEANRIRAAAEADGRREGHAQGLAAARADGEHARSVLEAAASQLESQLAAMVEQLERRAIDLSLALAEKIVGAALELRPELVLGAVTGALRQAAERDHVVIEVNPDDLELVRAEVDELAGRLGGIHRLEVVAERRVGRGGCVVRTSEGEIDARIGEQLVRARDLLLDSLAASKTGA